MIIVPQEMYEEMKTRIENMVERGYIADDYKTGEAFGEKAKDFRVENHPASVQVNTRSSFIHITSCHGNLFFID